MAERRRSVDPAKRPAETFTLYSIPAYDAGEPERLTGSEIGSTKQALEAGDVLLSRIVPHIRRAWIVNPTNGEPSIGSSEWIVFRGSGVEPAYLRHFLLSEGFHRQLMRTVAGVGGSLLRARPELVAKIEIRLPSRGEQRRIARALDAVDALRAKRRDALRWLDRLPGTLFHEMFGTATAEGAAWPRVPLSTIIQRAEGGRSFAGEDEKDRTARHRVLRVSAVTSNRFRPAESRPVPNGYEPPQAHVVRDGDLLFSRANTSELVGAVALVENPPENLLLPDKLWRLVWQDPNAVSPEFVWQLLQSPPVRGAVSQRATGTSGSMKNISAEKLLSISVIHPPLALQTRFGDRYRTIRLLQARAEAHLTHLDALFASLQSRAFKGEL